MTTKNKIKLAVAGLRGIPSVMGGVETHCEELYKRLSVDIDILIYGRKRYVASSILSKTMRVKSLYSPKQQSLETPFHTLIAIIHCFVFNKVDIFHIHGIGGSIFLPLAKVLFPKVVVTHHSQNYEHQKWGRFARIVFKCGERFALKYADKVLFVSKSLLAVSKHRYPQNKSKYHFIANGFSLPEISTKDNEVDSPFFLAVGRLVPEKGFHDLIEAFNLYEGDEKLIIAGDSDFNNGYTDKIKESAGSNIIFVGKKNRSQLKWLYNNCKSFILPSYSEGLPISALEAVSCSAHVIMSDIVQNKDLNFPDTSYFKLGNIEELHLKLKEGGVKVDKSLLRNYNWDNISTYYEKLLKEAIG
ncbi:hypothetical protein A2I98_12260 [Pseudoalteromonas agarivorans]|uniref:Glycosyltransferase subfamily 4-like N-terminal domain-containing protein n=1 Tax=Pseudoalteromonas agarivorans TaxID=176102 RepID=A0ABR5VX66_9GAMM|nr:glycosyltransferase family 4 protein [Pseudoalteromonas telluritireducens]KYL34313.1 hypothetical protein A2I98_12260 [Pseudoalteromonas telluritireducens]